MSFEVGAGELAMSVVAIGAFYLAVQWWSAQKIAASGVNGALAPSMSAAPSMMSVSRPMKRDAAVVSTVAVASHLPPMSIYWGSQSGTAESFAQELAIEASAYGFLATTRDLQDVDLESLQDEKFAVFLMATFGEGDPTDNAADFYTWINEKDREDNMMKGVTFAVFALGNRQYEHFCNIGRKVDARFGELGGLRLCDHGEGDDDGSLEGDFATWKSGFWAKTKLKFGLASAQPVKFKPGFSLEWTAESKAAGYKGGVSPSVCEPKHKPILATVVSTIELRGDVLSDAPFNAAGESTRHVEFDLSALRLSYATADNLGVCPRNDPASVPLVAARLGVKLDAVFTLNKLARKLPPIAGMCSVRDALLWYVDYASMPRATLLTTLAQYTEDEGEKALLASWTNDGQAKVDFHKDEHSIFEVLMMCPKIAVPFLDFLELCPRLQPRFYTISSSSLVQPKQVSITVSKATHAKTNGRVYHGLASTYILALKPQEQVCVFVRPSTFRLPKPKRIAGAATAILPPIIMVGPGTGIAPFRAFVQEFAYLRSKDLPSFPSTHLFFGCRNRSHDYIYRDELATATSSGALAVLHTAFSRETSSKVYVQNDLRRVGKDMWTLIESQRACFYVCGGTAMGREVKSVVQELAVEFGGLTHDQSVDYVKKMTKELRYIQELWS